MDRKAGKQYAHQPVSYTHLFDLLSFGGVHPDGKERKGYSKDYIHSFSAVMQQSFRFAVFPKQYITFNPMQYIKLRYQTDEVDLFSDEDMDCLLYTSFGLKMQIPLQKTKQQKYYLKFQRRLD